MTYVGNSAYVIFIPKLKAICHKSFEVVSKLINSVQKIQIYLDIWIFFCNFAHFFHNTHELRINIECCHG